MMDEKTTADIQRAVDELKEEMIDVLRRLVRIETVVGAEGPGQELVSGLYGDLGLEVETFTADKAGLKDHPAFVDSEIPFLGRPNVIGRLPGDPSKRSLILNGHMDVVSPEPVDQWTHDPWGAEIVGNRLFGRGAADMKAGLIANAFALKALLKSGHRPEGEVMLHSVIEEEAGGGGGALACLAKGFTADAMIIPEPLPVMCISHAGILYFKVIVKGLTAHAGWAHTGVNAIGKIMKIYQALADLDARRQAGVRFPLYQPEGNPACHLNMGKLTAGDWPSTVAGFAELECRVSFVPGETRPEIMKLIEETVADAARRDDWLITHPPEVKWWGWNAEPWYQDPDDPLVRMGLEKVAAVTGEKMTPVGSPAGLDNRFSSYFGFPSFCLGPRAENIHGFDECVHLDSLVDVTKVLALCTMDWCGRDRRKP
ncbi:MAG: ArgE/DapE family deacylase [Desulfobacterales bacterium]|nr:ArgE/DapE family deacylase [Desulfobacterales bacterium]